LPYGGGTRDQEVGLLDRMAWASATVSALSGYTNAPNLATWIKNNPELHDLYKDVVTMLNEDGLI
jgi:hypothetical protein